MPVFFTMSETCVCDIFVRNPGEHYEWYYFHFHVKTSTDQYRILIGAAGFQKDRIRVDVQDVPEDMPWMAAASTHYFSQELMSDIIPPSTYFYWEDFVGVERDAADVEAYPHPFMQHAVIRMVAPPGIAYYHISSPVGCRGFYRKAPAADLV